MSIVIRKAKMTDANVIHEMICELAEFEQGLDEVTITVEELRQGLMMQTLPFDCLIAEFSGEIVGFTLSFKTFSTWKGICYFLDDLYVREFFRNKGVGKALFNAVVEFARNLGAKRLEWVCLDWNTNAREFYEKVIGAQCLSEWIKYRLVLS